MTLKELSAWLGRDQLTVYKLLYALRTRGEVYVTEHGTWALAPGMVTL